MFSARVDELPTAGGSIDETRSAELESRSRLPARNVPVISADAVDRWPLSVALAAAMLPATCTAAAVMEAAISSPPTFASPRTPRPPSISTASVKRGVPALAERSSSVVTCRTTSSPSELSAIARFVSPLASISHWIHSTLSAAVSERRRACSSSSSSPGPSMPLAPTSPCMEAASPAPTLCRLLVALRCKLIGLVASSMVERKPAARWGEKAPTTLAASASERRR
mmetsp:Transcript_8202/g.17914  ORF Transcript_8202/g.17914 Transcript_8202/m.17914 type:complete len:226 (+) Transcript_8202:986-1663(+)